MNANHPLAPWLKQACPCQLREAKPQALAQCCGPWLAAPDPTGVPRLAPTAQALMRSRYSAYAFGGTEPSLENLMLAHLQRTWHPDFFPSDLVIAATQWTGLKVLSAPPPSPEHPDQATVTFQAHYKVGGRAHKMTENSQFVRLDGAWLYTCAVGDQASP